jgi:hypothetical protein
MAGPAYIRGDYWRICEGCGFKKRASETFKRWDGLFVCSDDFEERHPQDFVRGRADRQNVPHPRPEAVNSFVGALTTTVSGAASAGAVTVNVTSSARFAATDRIGILLDSGNEHRAVILSVPNSTSLTLTAALPSNVSAGCIVTNYSVISTPSL